MMQAPYSAYARGKLLITGEYLVLYGAPALAVPLKTGQELQLLDSAEQGILKWEAKDTSGLWFTAAIGLPDLSIIETTDAEVARRLVRLLEVARSLNGDFLTSAEGKRIVTTLGFDRHWGLGSSSTLTALVAGLAAADAMKLHRLTSKGSGYDVACALSDVPIRYRWDAEAPEILPADFNPPFAGDLYLIYLDKKQDSTAEVAAFMKKDASLLKSEIAEIGALTDRIIQCVDIESFNGLIERHEEIISAVTGKETIKKMYFSGFKGAVKSLGAWGGDFILAASSAGGDYVSSYFAAKGLKTVLGFREMVKLP